MTDDVKAEPVEAELKVTATVHENALFMREVIGWCESEAGLKVEVALNLSGEVLITIHRKKEDWTTYAIRPGELARAAVAAEESPNG